MKNIKIVVEKGNDLYAAYAENVSGIYGEGTTPAEAKDSALEAINLLKEHNSQKNIPAALKGEYQFVYKWDAASLLRYYKGIFTNAALERLTGIDQKQIQHYASGLKKPRPAQLKKIQDSFHKLGRELLDLEL